MSTTEIDSMSATTSSASTSPGDRRLLGATKHYIRRYVILEVLLLALLILGRRIASWCHDLPFPGFFCFDKSLSYPFVRSEIDRRAFLPGIIAPGFFIILFWEIMVWFVKDGPARRTIGGNVQLRILLCRLHYFMFKLALLFVTDMTVRACITKLWANPHPFFLTVCQPNYAKLQCFTEANQPHFVDPKHGGHYCREHRPPGVEKHDIHLAKAGFPSSHGSYSGAMFVYMLFYLGNRVRRPGYQVGALMLQLACVFLALIIAISPLPCYHHSPRQVVAGVVFGAVEGLFYAVPYGQFTHLPYWITFES